MEVVILDSGYKSYAFERELFEKNGFALKIYPGYKGPKSEKTAFSKNADGILVRHTIIDEEFLSEMKNLKAVVRYGVGYDNINIEACSRFNVKAANVQGYANQSVSDHALALIFSCARALWDPRQQLTRSFATPPAEDVLELNEKTLGIIGVGRIGSELCRKAQHLFKNVSGCDPYKSESHFRQLSLKKVGLNELLECSDVISLNCNLTSETRYLLDEEQFNRMKKSPIIINTSRGEVIREKALLDALNSGKIHSAGLDVYEDEPITGRQMKLVDHPRVIGTGHYAWYSERSMPELQRRAALNLLNLLKGNTIEDSLN